MKLSFDDKESFVEAAESLRFNNPPCPSDSYALQRMGSEDSERNEDIYLDNPPSDPNTLRQVESNAIQERSET
jgi:hypothetical protein